MLSQNSYVAQVIGMVEFRLINPWSVTLSDETNSAGVCSDGERVYGMGSFHYYDCTIYK